MRRNGSLIVMVWLAAMLVACSGTASQPASAATGTAIAQVKVDAVHIVRTSDSSAAQLPPFDHTGKDSAKVHALYAGLMVLPVYTAGSATCPTDSGVQYQLTFFNGTTTILTAIADPSGCQVAVLAGHDNRLAAQSDLWALMADAVGVQPSAVYPLGAQ